MMNLTRLRGLAILIAGLFCVAPVAAGAQTEIVPRSLATLTAITYTAAREGLASTMDEVCRDRSPVIITRNRNQSVVMLSLADYEQLEETSHLLRSPVNARRRRSGSG